MENVTWTGDRLGERFDAIDKQLRRDGSTVRGCGSTLQPDRIRVLLELRREMRAGFESLQTTLNRIGGGLLIALSGVIAAVLVKGA